MISVIIPVLNESETIVSVVDFARRSQQVSEVIVIDDGSIDNTADLARTAGARVLTSTLLGKGASMEDGIWAASNEIVVFLDGDLSQLEDDLVARLTAPLFQGHADFVKARFSRSGGRVTMLTARPLLATFFPELSPYEQPLGGIIAARRSFLRNLRLESDYGVDIGLLIDTVAAGARIVEVDVGHIEHDSQPLEALGDMARQVVRVILDRASRYNRFHIDQVREVDEIERRMQSELSVVLAKTGKVEKLALFDMDGVLLRDRFVVALARRVNRSNDLTEFLDRHDLDPDERTRNIARLFADVPREVIEQVAKQLPLNTGASETIIALRKAGYRVGIVTDSYRVVAEIVRRRVFADFSISHMLRYRRGIATGEITLSPAMRHPQGCTRHHHCKYNAMLHVAEKMGVLPDQILAVGDGENDICLLQSVGRSFAFQPKSAAVATASKWTVRDDLMRVLDLLDNEKVAQSA